MLTIIASEKHVSSEVGRNNLLEGRAGAQFSYLIGSMPGSHEGVFYKRNWRLM